MSALAGGMKSVRGAGHLFEQQRPNGEEYWQAMVDGCLRALNFRGPSSCADADSTAVVSGTRTQRVTAETGDLIAPTRFCFVQCQICLFEPFIEQHWIVECG